MPHPPFSRLEIVGEYGALTPFRAGGAEGDLALDSEGRPMIPATTFRGALRASIESMLRSMDSEALTSPFYVLVSDASGKPTPEVRRVSLCCDSVDKRADDADYQGCLTNAIVERWRADPILRPDFDRALIGCTCAVCRLFGTEWLGGRVRLDDLSLFESTWDRVYVLRGGVTIRRDTGTLLAGSAYTRQAVPAGTRFTFRLTLENATFAEQGMILLGLRAFQNGLIGLGADRGRGLGRGRLDIDWANCRYLDPANLIEVLIGEEFAPFTEADAEARIAAFAEMIRGLLRKP
jgi:CRISPR/Cas system CSM-associated protein Csm3 (group 7 of RAMP superfamily)